jgi:hypothetical protein
MVTEPLADDAAAVNDDEVRLKPQAVPSCVTVKVCPPTSIVPVRVAGSGFGSTMKFSVALPEPLPAPFNLSQEAPEVMLATQEQVDLLELTAKPPVWPAEAAEAEPGLSAYVQATTGVTVSVTGTTRGELVAPAAVMLTEPG